MIGFVYFIRPIGMEGPVKIGHSLDPSSRLEQLAAASPLQLEIAAIVEGNRALERNIQDCFADLHSHYEWFRADSRLSDAIDRLAQGESILNALDLNDRRGNVLFMIADATRVRNGNPTSAEARRRNREVNSAHNKKYEVA